MKHVIDRILCVVKTLWNMFWFLKEFDFLKEIFAVDGDEDEEHELEVPLDLPASPKSGASETEEIHGEK